MLMHFPLETRGRLLVQSHVWQQKHTEQAGLIKISRPSPLTIVTSSYLFLINQGRHCSVTQKSYLKGFMLYIIFPAASFPCFSQLASASGRQADASLICLPSSVPTLISLLPTAFRPILLGVSTCISIYYLLSQ